MAYSGELKADYSTGSYDFRDADGTNPRALKGRRDTAFQLGSTGCSARFEWRQAIHAHQICIFARRPWRPRKFFTTYLKFHGRCCVPFPFSMAAALEAALAHPPASPPRFAALLQVSTPLLPPLHIQIL